MSLDVPMVTRYGGYGIKNVVTEVGLRFFFKYLQNQYTCVYHRYKCVLVILLLLKSTNIFFNVYKQFCT